MNCLSKCAYSEKLTCPEKVLRANCNFGAVYRGGNLQRRATSGCRGNRTALFWKLKKSPLILEKIPGLIDWRCCITRKNLQNCSLFVGSLSLMCCRWNVYRGALFLTNLLYYEKVLVASLQSSHPFAILNLTNIKAI